jgi:PAS domain S-box-containing protein
MSGPVASRGPAWDRWLPWLPALTALLLLVALQWVVGATVGRELEARSLARVGQAATLYADQLGRMLARRHAEMRLFTREVDLASDRRPDQQRAALHRLKDLSSAYYWIAVIEPDGRVGAATDGLLEGASVATRPVFAAARASPYIGALHPSVALGPAALALGRPAPGELADIAMPLDAAAGPRVRVLAAHLTARHFDELRELALGPSVNRGSLDVALVAGDGRRLVGGLPALREGTLAPVSEGAAARVSHARDASGGRIVIAQAGVPLPGRLPALDWMVVASQPLDAALAPVLELQRTLWIVGGLVTLVLGGAGMWLSRRVARPLSAMLDVVGERLGPQASMSPADYLRVLTEAMRRLPPEGQRRTAGERMLDQLVHDAGRLHAVLDRVPAPLYLADLDNRVVFWNRRAAEVFGWSAADASGRAVQELIPPADESRAEVEALRARLAVEPGPWEIEAHVLTRYGGDFWGRWHLSRIDGLEGAPVGVLALVRDLTADVRAEATQREQALMLAGIVETATDAIVSVDPDGRITLFNPAAQRVFGWPAEAMLGQPLDRLLPTDVLSRHGTDMREFARSQTTRRAMGRGIVRGLHADGRVLQLEASISQVTVARRQVLTAILRDVTERLRDERALESYRQDLAALARRLMDQEKQTTQHLAQMLHDQLGQMLVAARMTAEALMVAMRGRWPAGEQSRAERLAALVDDAQREVRGALVELRPPLLDEAGLAAALENEVRLRSPGAAPVQLRLEVAPAARGQRWPGEVEYAAFMVAREALANALQHARAQEVVIALGGDSGEIALEVRDDGVGLAEGALAPRPGHLGLVGMRERALAVGARVALGGAEPRGTVMRFAWELQS